MLTRLTLLCALAGALFTLSCSPSLALSESDQDKAIAQLQSAVASLQNTVNTQQTTITAQAAQIAALQKKTAPLSVQTDTMRTDGRKYTELYITRANLHIVNGLGATDGDPNHTTTKQVNGLGNVILGYNAARDAAIGPVVRTGSHNLVIGDRHNYSSYGGLVTGELNTISGPFACVSGGVDNTASGQDSSVSGGDHNMALGGSSSVSGGYFNYARSLSSSVGGGTSNLASGLFSSVGGGYFNTASGQNSSVGGGDHNTASGQYSSVSGGSGRSATDLDDWVAGTLFQDQ